MVRKSKMKAYGKKSKIRHSGRKVRSHRDCGICHNFKIVKKSARQESRRIINEECVTYFYGADIRGSRDRSGIPRQEGQVA